MLGIEITTAQISNAIAAFMAIPAVPLLIAAVVGLSLFVTIIRALYSIIGR